MQIATWNVNSLKVRCEQVIAWLEKTGCDVLALQELKLDNANFPSALFNQLGYHCVFNGQKTYNGVAIISRHPIHDVVYDMPDFADEQKRVISATVNGIRIMCVYVVNGEAVGSLKYEYKLNWCNAWLQYVEQSHQLHKELIVLGDYNIAPHDIDMYDPISWQGKILCSAAEREVWRNLLQIGMHDGFRLFNRRPNQYSWWDYRSFAFKRKLGLRIDHIVLSDGLKARALDCQIDIEPRRHERPSDHTPVIIMLDA